MMRPGSSPDLSRPDELQKALETSYVAQYVPVGALGKLRSDAAAMGAPSANVTAMVEAAAAAPPLGSIRPSPRPRRATGDSMPQSWRLIAQGSANGALAFAPVPSPTLPSTPSELLGAAPTTPARHGKKSSCGFSPLDGSSRLSQGEEMSPFYNPDIRSVEAGLRTAGSVRSAGTGGRHGLSPIDSDPATSERGSERGDSERSNEEEAEAKPDVPPRSEGEKGGTPERRRRVWGGLLRARNMSDMVRAGADVLGAQSRSGQGGGGGAGQGGGAGHSGEQSGAQSALSPTLDALHGAEAVASEALAVSLAATEAAAEAVVEGGNAVTPTGNWSRGSLGSLVPSSLSAAHAEEMRLAGELAEEVAGEVAGEGVEEGMGAQYSWLNLRMGQRVRAPSTAYTDRHAERPDVPAPHSSWPFLLSTSTLTST